MLRDGFSRSARISPKSSSASSSGDEPRNSAAFVEQESDLRTRGLQRPQHVDGRSVFGKGRHIPDAGSEVDVAAEQLQHHVVGNDVSEGLAVGVANRERAWEVSRSVPSTTERGEPKESHAIS